MCFKLKASQFVPLFQNFLQLFLLDEFLASADFLNPNRRSLIKFCLNKRQINAFTEQYERQ